MEGSTHRKAAFVPVSYEVAWALRCPLDVLLVRKLGAPHNPELAMGAIATGEAIYLNDSVLSALHVREEQVLEAIARERVELRHRELAYRGQQPPAHVEGKTVIVVDDGLATGSTMHAALDAAKPASTRPRRLRLPDAGRRATTRCELVSMLRMTGNRRPRAATARAGVLLPRKTALTDPLTARAPRQPQRSALERGLPRAGGLREATRMERLHHAAIETPFLAVRSLARRLNGNGTDYDVLQLVALGHDGLRERCRGGRAIARELAGARGDFAQDAVQSAADLRTLRWRDLG